MYDVFLVNAAKGINKKVLENNGIAPQEYIYKKYDIDSLQFAKSNNYYVYDFKTYEDIIEKVKQRIESEKGKYEAINLKEEKTKDSIQEAKQKEKITDTFLKVDRKLKLADSLHPLKNTARQR